MSARVTRRVLVVALLGLAAFLPAGSALAQGAPANDDFSNATIISALPFTNNVDTTGATSAADDPAGCGNNGSVWYAFTPSQTEAITANTFGSNYDTILSVFTGTRGALTLVACNDDSAGTLQSEVDFTATAGTTYFFMISQCCGSGGSGGGQLAFNVSAPTPPANDNFSNATQITALPFSDTVDTRGATLEPGEPACNFSPLAGSVWYAFTPASTESVSASIDSSFSSVTAVYTGTSLSHLTSLGCAQSFGGLFTIHVNAGTTYYFQVGGAVGSAGSLTFHLIVTPPPTANFLAIPFDPSIFDTVQFIDESFDPGQVGIQTVAWNFGDGTTSTGVNPTHQYAVDGDYTVRLTVTTSDGRTGSTSQVISVRTHDVSITKFTVPTSASAGQTRSITVGVGDHRYPETVQVQLLKGNAQGGFDIVGTLTQSITLSTGMSTVAFAFSYTFTPGDAAVGKVTFEAIATILGARDALPADNTAIATTTVH
jgi:PKD repeat protein